MKAVYVTGRHAESVAVLLAKVLPDVTVLSLKEITSLNTSRCLVVLSIADASYALCEVNALRKANYSGKILALLGVEPDEEELIELYSSGIDNCVSGTDSNTLLIAIVRSLCDDRYHQLTAVHKLGNMRIERAAHRVTVDGKSVHLGPNEYHLLILFVQEVGVLLTRQDIVKQMKRNTSVDLQTVSGYVARLRRALTEARASGFTITTVYGEGYQLSIQE